MTCPASAFASENQPSTVRAGFYAFSGYHEMDENGVKGGYGYDFLTLVKRYADVNFEYIGFEKKWDDMLQMLLDGEIDMVTSAHKTEDREVLFDYSLPIGTNTINLNVRADEERFIAGDYSSYDGMTVGILSGSVSDKKIKRFAQENHFTVNTKYYPDTDALKKALANGEVDGLATTSLRRTENEKTIAEFDTENFYAIVKKGNKELLGKINEAIIAMNSSEINWKAALNYNNYDLPNHGNLNFSEKELAYIADHSQGGKKIVIAYDNEWAPFAYKNNGTYTGIFPELWQEIMKITGMKYRVYDSKNNIFDENNILEGKADIYLGYCFDANESEVNGFVESSPIMSVEAAMLTRKGSHSLKKIAVSDINPRLNSLLKLKDDQKAIHFANSRIATEALQKGEVDAVFLYAYEGELFVNTDKTGLFVYQPIADIEMNLCAIVPENGSHVLIGIVSKCINSMKKSDINTIIARNMTLGVDDLSFKDYFKVHPIISTTVAVGIVTLMVCVLFSFVWGQTERKLRDAMEVQVEKTMALNEQLHDKQALLNESLEKQELQLKKITAMNAQLAKKNNHITELSKKFKEYLDIVANTGYGIWQITISKDGRRAMVVDETLQKVLGISGMNLSPEELYVYYHGRLAEDLTEIEEKDYVQMAGGKLKGRILKYNHPTKGVISLNAGGTIQDQQDGNSRISGYCVDITEQQREQSELNQQLRDALSQAEKANHSKSEFLSNMSHDIRTPMNAILGYANLIKKNPDDREQCSAYLDKIITSGDFLLDLINNVLEMARIESGRMVLDETTLPVLAFLDSLCTVIEEQIRQKDITFTRTSDIRNEYVLCDSVKTREIFLNILSNAVKYTPKGGSIHLALEELPSDREGYALMQTTISDTGIGMSQEYLPHIFETFTREKSVTENKIQGTGLGMPIVKKLVDLSGGTIDVKSELGKGTTFVVRLYHKISNADAIRKTISPEEVAMNFTGKRLLLAEDNDLNAEIAMEILKETGIGVDRAEDGIICLDMLRKVPADYYDLILMDIQMPNLDGYKTTEKIRRAGSHIPIIAMTANAFDEDKAAALAVGMNGHLAKPINITELMKALTEFLG